VRLRRRLLLVIGAIALIASAVLAVLWLRLPTEQAKATLTSDSPQVLSAARLLPGRSLLRRDDLTWRAVPTVPAGAWVRGSASEGDFVGAVVLRDLRPGDTLTADLIVKPNEPGFLPSVLGRDMRAVSIAVGMAEGASGLIVPGDRVDVILVQHFGEPGMALPQRSVSETILRNLRVIAIDQTISNEPRAKGGETHIAKTVTLEVTAPQAESLTVAMQLGKLQLALRNSGDNPASGWSGETTSTWGSDVSPALRGLARDPSNALPGAQPGQRTPPEVGHPTTAVDVFRGDKAEQRCFDETGRRMKSCPALPQSVAPAVEPEPERNQPEPPAAPPSSRNL
jgi:pilus assembly protein CpaB